MLSKKLETYIPFAIVPLLLALVVPGSAQQKQPQDLSGGRTYSNAALTGSLVKTGLYMFSSDAGNTLLRLSGNGLILVDGQLPANYDALRTQVKKISNQPIRALIVTDYRESHNGTYAKFRNDGTPILIQENFKGKLSENNPPGQQIATPIKTYDKDFDLRVGGVEAQLMHFGNAYTNGDTVVYFPNLKVVAVGSLYGATPSPDYSAGGSLVGWGPVLGKILKLDFDVVVPSAGPPVTRADLEAFKGKIDTMVARATQLVNDGVPKDQLMAQLKTEDLGWHMILTPDQLNSFYSELSRTEQPRNGS